MRMLLFGLCAVGIETALFLASKDIDLYLAVLIHGSICLAIALSARYLTREIELRSYFVQLALWTFVAGPFGAMITPCGSRLKSRFSNGAHFKSSLNSYNFETNRMDRVFRLLNELHDRRIKVSGTVLPAPLIEVLFEGSQKEKFDTLNLIGRRFDPSLLPVLRVATQDPDLSVRVLAGTIKSKLQKKMSDDGVLPPSGKSNGRPASTADRYKREIQLT